MYCNIIYCQIVQRYYMNPLFHDAFFGLGFRSTMPAIERDVILSNYI